MPIGVLTLPASHSATASIRARAFVFEDPLSQRIHERLERIAPSDVPVLVTGETGTGKELVARQLHALSRRAERPFVAVNVGALSETLIESELFGHEKGAFTGALTSKPGYFEAAHGGTLFLDELGELALPLQVKLLRVLQERQVTRLGARTPRDVDVRLIAATNVDLSAAMRAKHFREDLYYRLRVSTLRLPPLRERPGDILPLARHFVSIYAPKLGKKAVRLDESAIDCLRRHAWPGNIRELENTIHHALVVCQNDVLSRSDLELGTPVLTSSALELQEARQHELTSVPLESSEPPDELTSLRDALQRLVQRREPNLHARVEETLFSVAYEAARQNQLETARLLGVSRNVVRARLIEQGALPGPLRRSTTVNVARERVVRIGYQKLGLLMLLRHSGRLDRALGELHARAEWVEYEGGIQMVEALKAGALDVAGLGNCPAVVAQAEQVNRGAQAHYLLMCALEEVGLERDALDVRFEAPERALLAFRRGEVDGWAIWDPFVPFGELFPFRGFAKKIYDGSSTGVTTTHGVQVRSDFAAKYPEVVVAYLKATLEAERLFREKPEELSEKLAGWTGVDAEVYYAFQGRRGFRRATAR